MSLPTELDLLKRGINKIRVKNWNAQRFVPEDKLCDLMSRDMIAKVLGNLCPPYLCEEITDFILKRALKVFGILVLIDEVSQIQRFIQNDQYGTHKVDHQLPFTEEKLKEIFQGDYVADLFHEKQWEFAVPTFSGQVVPRTLELRTVLPYLSDIHLITSGFGSIYKVKIHPYYQPPSFEATAEFVRKELDLYDTTFENEARILSSLQRLKHPNILLLIGCYTYRSKHNFVSPFIEGGTLRDLLKQEKTSDLSREKLFYALAGLASAIWALHEFVLDDSEPSLKGCHQDLKPDNILVDTRDFRFILADFGLSSIKNLTSNSRTPFKGRKGYCQAPECVELSHPYQEHEATRATDIFAFACIIADLLIYLLKGPSGVREFRDAREFHVPPMCYNLYHKGDASNDAVANWLKQIANEDGSQSLREVVRLVTQMLEISPSKRPSAAVVTAKLYTSTIKAFSQKLLDLFALLPSTWEVLIEKSRFLSWLACQDIGHFLSMPGATSSNRIFDSMIQLLRQIEKALEAIDRNISRPDRRSLIEVRMLNTQLLNMLSPERRSSSRSHLESVLIVEVELANIDVAPALLESALGSSKIAKMAETKRLVAQVIDVAVPLNSLSFRTISSAEFSKKTSGKLKTAKLHYRQQGQSTSMLLETVQYQDPLTGQRLLPRFHALCELLSSKNLPQKLRIPPFFALCNNTDAFCFDLLYEYPRDNGAETNQTNPVSLRELLTEREVPNYPPLQSRLKLALDLAEALAAFHDVSWFHKDLTSSNILFFPPNDIVPSARIHNPYLFGFQHSRDATDDFTEGPLQDRRHQRYHHPDYISVENHKFKRFVRQYDWYGLGIILFEIGFWTATDVIMVDYKNERNNDFAKILSHEKLPLLSFYMGTEYVEIVKYCLTCSNYFSPDNECGDMSSTQANLVFKNNVVLPLQGLASRHPAPQATKKRKSIEEWDEKALGSSKRRAA